MNKGPASVCLVHDSADKRKSAVIAFENTRPDEGEHWVKKPGLARKILRMTPRFLSPIAISDQHFIVMNEASTITTGLTSSALP
jgi:DNA replication initiation complex subunit (GINS family)